MSERATRPLNQAAGKAADDDLYSKHADDPRPNALYDDQGNRKPLDPTDPDQADARQEYLDAYKANGGDTEPADVSGSQPDQPVLPCGQMQAVDPVIDADPVEVDDSDVEPPDPEEEPDSDDDAAVSDEQVISDNEEGSDSDDDGESEGNDDQDSDADGGEESGSDDAPEDDDQNGGSA